MIRKYLALYLACMMTLSLSAAVALELSDEQFDAWYNEMVWLVEEIGIRKVGRPGEKEACDYLRDQFKALGFCYEEGTLVESYSRPRERYDECVSLIAIKRALSEHPKILTVCAHYDSIYEGARDNASGVAALLVLAKIFSELPPFQDTELRFIAFGAEELGMYGSAAYCASLSQDEKERSLAAFNLDIVTVDVWEPLAFSIDTLGMPTEEGYLNGSDEEPACNRTALAMLAAMDELGTFALDEEDITWCLPRHMGKSDHQSFHEYGIDAANICFRGTRADGGGWPEFMHTPTDVIGDFDLDRTWNALNAIYTAVDGLANDHNYGR